MDYSPVMEQDGYAIGDPGTENGHTLGTQDTARTLSGGSGDVDVFLRVQIYQSQGAANINLTKTLKLKANFNGAGYLDVPASGAGDASHPVEMVNHASITHGGDTTERLTAPAGGSFLSNNQGQCDTSSTQGASFTWPSAAQSYLELLFSLRCLDTYLSDTDQILFQVTESGDTALSAYDVTPTINWSVTAPVEEAFPITAAIFRQTNANLGLTAARVVSLDAQNQVTTHSDIEFGYTRAISLDQASFPTTQADVALIHQTRFSVDANTFPTTQADIGLQAHARTTLTATTFNQTHSDLALRTQSLAALSSQVFPATFSPIAFAYVPAGGSPPASVDTPLNLWDRLVRLFAKRRSDTPRYDWRLRANEELVNKVRTRSHI